MTGSNHIAPSLRRIGLLTALPCALAAFCLLLTLSASLPATAGEEADEYRDMKNPETIEEDEVRYYTRQFKGKCSRCHGVDGTGKGSSYSEEDLVQPANFTDAEYMASRTDGQLFRQILLGGGDRCAMPAFGPESDHGWSEEKVWHMVAFVRRFAEPPSD